MLFPFLHGVIGAVEPAPPPLPGDLMGECKFPLSASSAYIRAILGRPAAEAVGPSDQVHYLYCRTGRVDGDFEVSAATKAYGTSRAVSADTSHVTWVSYQWRVELPEVVPVASQDIGLIAQLILSAPGALIPITTLSVYRRKNGEVVAQSETTSGIEEVSLGEVPGTTIVFQHDNQANTFSIVLPDGQALYTGAMLRNITVRVSLGRRNGTVIKDRGYVLSFFETDQSEWSASVDPKWRSLCARPMQLPAGEDFAPVTTLSAAIQSIVNKQDLSTHDYEDYAPVTTLSASIHSIVSQNRMVSWDWSPADRFSEGVAGVWFQPSDDRTCFQDVAGTTPALADGDPVALIVNKAREKDWVKVNTVDSVDGVPLSSPIARYLVTGNLVAGRRYIVSFDVEDYQTTTPGAVLGISASSGGTAPSAFPSASTVTPSRISDNGRVCIYAVAEQEGGVYLYTGTSTTCNFRNIEVWEIPADNSDLTLSGAATNRAQLKIDGVRRFLRGGAGGLNCRLHFIAPEYTTDRISIGIAMQRDPGAVYTSWRSAATTLGYVVGLGHTAAGPAITPSSRAGNKFLLNGEDQGTVGTRVAMINGGDPYVGILQGTLAAYPSADTPEVRILGYSTTTLAGHNDLFEYLEVEGEDFGVHWGQVDRYLQMAINPMSDFAPATTLTASVQNIEIKRVIE